VGEKEFEKSKKINNFQFSAQPLGLAGHCTGASHLTEEDEGLPDPSW